MEVFELVRLALAIAMFSFGAYYDWKTGMISEKLWLVFAIMVIPVYVLDPPTYGTVWIIGLGAAVALAGRLAGLYATGDLEALLALSLILPVFNGANTSQSFSDIIPGHNRHQMRTLLLLVQAGLVRILPSRFRSP